MKKHERITVVDCVDWFMTQAPMWAIVPITLLITVVLFNAGGSLVEAINTISQPLAQLHSLLIKRVDSPNEALKGHLVLIEREQLTQSIGVELRQHQKRARTVSCKVLIGILMLLTRCQGHHLSHQIGEQELLLP